MNEVDSYIYGLLITDGNLNLRTRNRGKVTLEVSIKDSDIVEKLYSVIPGSNPIRERTRTTNFSESYVSKIFSNTKLEFRQKLINQGFPIKNKTLYANTPKVPYKKYDFWRGVIDGDGSLGFTGEGIPFVSLVTKSEILKDEYLKFLNEEFGIVKNIHRNKRDNVYNIYLSGEKAIKLAKLLYLNTKNNLYLNRKYDKALEMNR